MSSENQERGDKASENEALDLEAFGAKARLSGQKIVSGNILIALIITLVCALGYKHHTANEEMLTRILEATTENTYVLSLSQPDRERLNIAMPESLRRKMRPRGGGHGISEP